MRTVSFRHSCENGMTSTRRRNTRAFTDSHGKVLISSQREVRADTFAKHTHTTQLGTL